MLRPYNCHSVQQGLQHQPVTTSEYAFFLVRRRLTHCALQYPVAFAPRRWQDSSRPVADY